ncbi:MAG TPA: TetR/AcrR family transcriptional regulator [Kofleriaceae bacterium]
MANERLSSADRKRQIAEAALRILASQGAHRLTAMEISRSLGITDAALFRHFRDKNEIIAAAITRFEELLAGDIVDDLGDPLARLGAFFVRRVGKARSHPEILGLAFNDRLAEIAGPEGAVRVQRMVGRSVGFVRACLEEAQRKRITAADVPADLLVWMVIGCLRGAATATKRPLVPPEAVWADLEKLLRRMPRRARQPASRRGREVQL